MSASSAALPALSSFFRGTLIHAPEWGAGVEIMQDQLLGVEAASGRIAFVRAYSAEAAAAVEREYALPAAGLTTLPATQFLIPGFIDTHCHAPQFQFAGTGTDRDLMVWLQTYTFPAEVRMGDAAFAKAVYARLVKAALAAGTTTAFYYGTIHLEGTQALVDQCVLQGQRAFVGKVNMDQYSAPDYTETTEGSLRDTEAFIDYCKALPDAARAIVQPVITPRFIPTCSPALLAGLGELAKKHDLWIQSHASESSDQVAFVQSLLPEVGSAPAGSNAVETAGLLNGRCTGIFSHFNLLSSKCMMAHGTFLHPSEWNVFRERGVSVAHCPLSNSFCSDRYLKLKPLVNNGNKVGLGSDVAGGYALSILHGLRQAVVTSKFFTADVQAHAEETVHVGSNGASASAAAAGDVSAPPRPLSETAKAAQVARAAANDNTVNPSTLSYADAFWLATSGGAEAINMKHELGRFAAGYLFDVQRIDVAPLDGAGEPLHTQLHLFPSDSLADVFQKFVHLGDDRHVAEVFVQGRKVKGAGIGSNASAPVAAAPAQLMSNGVAAEAIKNAQAAAGMEVAASARS